MHMKAKFVERISMRFLMYFVPMRTENNPLMTKHLVEKRMVNVGHPIKIANVAERQWYLHWKKWLSAVRCSVYQNSLWCPVKLGFLQDWVLNYYVVEGFTAVLS